MIVPRKLQLMLTCLFAFLPGLATAQEACTTYGVREGDSLATIAMSAYGSYDYQKIFNANRDILVNSPNDLAIGTQLVLPCTDGRISPNADLDVVSRQEEAKYEASSAGKSLYEPAIRFATVDDWAPFADDDLPGGGIMSRLAQTALRRGGNDRESTFASINDSSAHLDTLLPNGAMDFSSAWMIPDCTKLDMLGAASARMCTEFDATDPVYEVAINYVTLSDSKYAGAKTYSDFLGARMCRPDGWEMHMLEEMGLTEPAIKLVQPKTSLECAEAVLDGSADVFVAEIELAVDHFAQLGATDKVSYNKHLVEISAFRYLIAKTNPRAKIYVAMINRGLTEMRETGEWYEVVASSLEDYNKSKQ